MTKKVSKKIVEQSKSEIKSSEIKSIEDITLERTNKWAEKYEYPGYCIESIKSEKAIKIKQCLETNNFNGKEEDLAKIISLIIGEEIIINDNKKVSFEKGVMIVPLIFDNVHNYPLGFPVLMCNSSQIGIRSDGISGNNMTVQKNSIRPATKEEIYKFFEEYKK
jgi:hypothetical protein